MEERNAKVAAATAQKTTQARIKRQTKHDLGFVSERCADNTGRRFCGSCEVSVVCFCIGIGFLFTASRQIE